MAITNSPPAGDILTEDLINEILLRLPVKSLLRCQLVSKTWFSLITNPSFVKSQLLHAIASSDANQTLIVKSEVSDTPISLLHVDSRQIVADLNFPYSQGEFESVPDCILVGSANGIVCVSIAVSETPPNQDWFFSSFANRKTNTYLWNPATRQSKVVPSFSICHDIRREALGFGFDPIDNDFKVVRVVSPPFSAEIYSVNSNAWREVPKPMDIPWNDDFDVCVNGFLCCTGMYGMMAFDLNKEVLNCAIKFPVCTFDARIIEFNDSIAVIVSMANESNDKINMWTLDDEACLCGGGVEASWTLMFSVDLDLLVQFVYSYFRNGDLLLMTDDDEWLVYDFYKKEARVVPVSINVYQTYKYTESLVSVPGFKQDNWNAGEDDN
ncbi:F-box domain-containing protein [Heracleum sosnowskyi]|uniref:F-box domain-containing protein n=1 Tax=Heracleum sosnowskyi TaxID=360622 RepID=A0AAD8H305_9APIA|nr:F-box domain-containing protein [Heracleum sosnowskyi]